MADSAKKAKVAATPRQASASKVKATEVAKPTTTPRTGIELVANVKAPKKAKTAAQPRRLRPRAKMLSPYQCQHAM